MNLFKKWSIPFGNKKNKMLPSGMAFRSNNTIEPTIFSQTDVSAYKTLATFDIHLEGPKYEGAIPEATIQFYPMNTTGQNLK